MPAAPSIMSETPACCLTAHGSPDVLDLVLALEQPVPQGEG